MDKMYTFELNSKKEILVAAREELFEKKYHLLRFLFEGAMLLNSGYACLKYPNHYFLLVKGLVEEFPVLAEHIPEFDGRNACILIRYLVNIYPLLFDLINFFNLSESNISVCN